MSIRDTSRRTVLKVAGGLAAVVGGASVVGVAGADEDEEDEREDDEEAEVEFDDQTVGADGTPTVYVEEVKIPSGGWVVVHNWGTDGVTDENPAENFVGVSAYLEPGEYEHLPVELGGDRAVADPPEPSEDTTYTVSAMAHRDDPSNRTFDFPNEADDGESPDDPPSPTTTATSSSRSPT